VTWQCLRDRPTSVYRLFDADDRLLYVGCSEYWNLRINAHRRDKDWFPTVTRTTVERFPTREEALAAELAAIRTEAPIHNVRGKVQEKQPMTTLELQVKPEFRLRLKLAAIWADVREGQFVNRAILEMFPEPIKESPALGGA
jgi:predicted GIY-YIG superfamily endonuclease